MGIQFQFGLMHWISQINKYSKKAKGNHKKLEHILDLFFWLKDQISLRKLTQKRMAQIQQYKQSS